MRLQTKYCRADVRRLLASLQDILALESSKNWTIGKQVARGVSAGVRSNSKMEQSRDVVAAWLLQLNHEQGLNPETFVLSVYIMDRFLVVVKAHPKYMHCIAVSCLFLAMKCVEEDEAIPSTHDLVLITGCGCSVAEILRMERVILNKLDWDLQPFKSPLDFLHVLHAILLLKQTTWFSSDEMEDRDGCRLMANRQLSSLTRKLFACLLRRGVVLEFRPSTLALALVSLELGLCTENWLAATVALQRLTGVDETDLIRCREVASRILVADHNRAAIASRRQNLQQRHHHHHRRRRRSPPPVPIPRPSSTSLLYRNQQRHNVTLTKCEPMACDDRDDEDIHDAIKRLYGDILSP